jgi:hypothetical protein
MFCGLCGLSSRPLREIFLGKENFELGTMFQNEVETEGPERLL